jgi:uncharacterized Tic20 family protein
MGNGHIILIETFIMNGTEPIEKPDRTWDILCHLTALAGFVGIPLGNILGPLILWLIKKQDVPSVDAHGKEALNFQISMTIYSIVAGLCIFILIGIVLLPVVLTANLIFIIIAAVKASNGEFYQYPFTIRFVT